MQKRTNPAQVKRGAKGKTAIVWSAKKAQALRQASRLPTAGYCNCGK